MYTHVSISIYIYIYIYREREREREIYTHVCVCVYIYIYIYRCIYRLSSHNVHSHKFNPGSQIPIPNTWNCVLNHSKSINCLWKCMHARIQSPTILKGTKNMKF